MEATWNHGGHCRSANANKDAPLENSWKQWKQFD